MNLILDILFPKKCIGCKKEGSYFCQDCVSNILQTYLVCPQCQDLAIGGQTHPLCKRKYGLDGLWSLGLYQGSLRRVIQKLKYEPFLVKEFAPVLVDIMLEYWAKYQPFVLDQIKRDRGQGWVVMSVPLHWYRENKRGFNQSAEIGQLLSKKLGLGYCDGLKRVRYTKPQVRLKRIDRWENIKGAFAVAKPLERKLASSAYLLNHGPYVLLVDDVWTTGSTLKECCFVLKKAGAKKVWAVTLAR